MKVRELIKELKKFDPEAEASLFEDRSDDGVSEVVKLKEYPEDYPGRVFITC